MAMPSKSKTKEEQKEEKYCIQLDKDLYEWLKEIATNMGKDVDDLVTFMVWRYREVCEVIRFIEYMKLKGTESVKHDEVRP
jgi:fructose-1,6-bisphosphatase/sedoheptulose 1,7-bisphosphatase-like protein